MANPFKIFVVIAAIVALVLVVGFIYVFFIDPGNHGSLNVPRAQAALSAQTHVVEIA